MHYSSYLTYTNNLNAIAGTEYENQSIENILSKLDLNNSDLEIMLEDIITILY
jgi:Fe-Mn family superoxide dismutase